MSSITLNGDISGSAIITVPSVAGTPTLTLPTTSGTFLTTANTFANSGGPAFSVYLASNQTIANNTATKVTFNTKEFDTNSNFDATTNYRFTPTVAGYYNLMVNIVGPNSTAGYLYSFIYKNGSAVCALASTPNISLSASVGGSFLSYANGTTDYFEVYVTQTTGASSVIYSGATTSCKFQGFLARGA